ncbi:hypothetical protein LIA77_08858 [Sarocladium implicatum]|nr:hypothetical protein LIA77_08858 [Sarocladium implicatum]
MVQALIVILALTCQVLADGNTNNCPGVIEGENTGPNPTGYCCVGGHVTNSICNGWPNCKGPVTVTKTSPECSTKVPFTIDDYDSVIESASSRYLTDGWNAMETDDSQSKETGASSASGDGNDGPDPTKTADAGTASETDSGAAALSVAAFIPAALGAMAVGVLF